MGCLLLSSLSGCSDFAGSGTGDLHGRTAGIGHPSTGPVAPADPDVLRIATTTSLRDSGLLELLIPVFERRHECRVDTIAVGTGAALKLGEAGDVDVLLVHARPAEEAFMKAGHGIRHEPFMHNFFLIAGPADDPAAVRGLSAGAAFRNIASSQQLFVSRGDGSGTHSRELSLWRTAGDLPDWKGYIESGRGMGATLVMADEMNAYVLTDQATWLRQSGQFQLVPLVTAVDGLRNPYAVIAVNPAVNTSINAALADDFVDFLLSKDVQKMIDGFSVNGRQMFHADRLTEAGEA